MPEENLIFSATMVEKKTFEVTIGYHSGLWKWKSSLAGHAAWSAGHASKEEMLESVFILTGILLWCEK